MANYKSTFPCVSCQEEGLNKVTFHHLYTRGSHPEHKNKEWNKIPCCKLCHRLFHSHGTNFMADRFIPVKQWLLENKWEFCDFSKKWRHFESE